jgi:hypothetical protein
VSARATVAVNAETPINPLTKRPRDNAHAFGAMRAVRKIIESGKWSIIDRYKLFPDLKRPLVQSSNYILG